MLSKRPNACCTRFDFIITGVQEKKFAYLQIGVTISENPRDNNRNCNSNCANTKIISITPFRFSSANAYTWAMPVICLRKKCIQKQSACKKKTWFSKSCVLKQLFLSIFASNNNNATRNRILKLLKQFLRKNLKVNRWLEHVLPANLSIHQFSHSFADWLIFFLLYFL